MTLYQYKGTVAGLNRLVEKPAGLALDGLTKFLDNWERAVSRAVDRIAATWTPEEVLAHEDPSHSDE